MKINLKKCTELDADELREKTRKIFQASSAHGRHYCYVDSEGRVYVKNAYSEVDKYLIFEIGSEMGVFYVIELGISDIGIARGHIPEVNLYIAGSGGILTVTKSEAIEFLISKVTRFFEHEKIDADGTTDLLREALLPDEKLNSRKFIM
jgi:hypothetical protein